MKVWDCHLHQEFFAMNINNENKSIIIKHYKYNLKYSTNQEKC